MDGWRAETGVRRRSCSPERRLVERAQFPAVQLRPLVVEQFAGADADLEVRGDRFFIEAVRLARQLEFAMERLVADAKQGAIGDAAAIALRGHNSEERRVGKKWV